MQKKIIDKFNYKITDASNIKKKYKTTKQKVILCHGVFDIVQPGHIRHLI